MITEQPMVAHERRSKPVWCFTTGGEFVSKFGSVKDAAQCYKISAGVIVTCCKGKYKTAGGLVWSYTDKYPGYKKNQPWNKRAVDCYSLDGVLLTTYESASAAERLTGILDSVINNCVNGGAFSAGGFRWANHNRPIVNNTTATSNIAGRRRRKVGQFNTNNELICVYDRIVDAAIATRCSSICSVLAGKTKTAGGFIWKYMDIIN